MFRQRPLVFWSILLCLLSGTALAATGKPEAPPSLARPTHGKVIGYVLDAQTRHPVSGVRVLVEENGALQSFSFSSPSSTRSSGLIKSPFPANDNRH